jgi:hypothetical protein
MTHRLPNGGKGVRFWIFARLHCAGCCTGVSTCGRFSRIPSLPHRNPVRKKRHNNRIPFAARHSRARAVGKARTPPSISRAPFGGSHGGASQGGLRAGAPAIARVRQQRQPNLRLAHGDVQAKGAWNSARTLPGSNLGGARRRRRRLHATHRRAAAPRPPNDAATAGTKDGKPTEPTLNPHGFSHHHPSFTSLRAVSPRTLFARARALKNVVDPRSFVRHSRFVSVHVYSSNRRW